MQVCDNVGLEQRTDLKLNSGLGKDHGGLPRLMRTYLSRAAFQVLEAVRLNISGAKGYTTYNEVMFCSGIGSRATLSRVLRELSGVGAINYQATREKNGRVLGLQITYLGLPVTVSEVARQFFAAPLQERIRKLHDRVKEIETFDRERPRTEPCLNPTLPPQPK